MAKGIIRTKAKTKNGSTSVKIMAKHVMETGNRKDKKGNILGTNGYSCKAQALMDPTCVPVKPN